jgi:hypothetical protein
MKKPPTMPVELVWSNRARTDLLDIYIDLLERPCSVPSRKTTRSAMAA